MSISSTDAHRAGAPARLSLDGALAQRLTARPLLLLLDVDGTLAPIVAKADEAAIPEATKRALATLAAREGTEVALVSGRAALDARRMASIPGLWCIGNHGIETVGPDGELVIDARAAAYLPMMRESAARLERELGALDGVFVEDKKWSLSIHVRLAPRELVPTVEHAVRETARASGLRMTAGKEVFELRPPVEVNKGTAALALIARLLGERGGSFLAAGDDRTDEDLFVALRSHDERAVTVRVAAAAEGARETRAEFVVPDTEAVRALLEWLARAPA